MSNESPTPGGESAPDRGPLSTDQPGPDDLFAHGLLGFVHTDTPERQRQRVTRAMHAIHAGDVAAVAGRIPGRGLRVGRWVSGLAASIAVIGAVYVATIPRESSAEAAVQQLISSTRSGGDRRFEIRILDRPDAPIPQNPTAVVDMRGTGSSTHVLLDINVPVKMFAGRDATGEWVRRPDGRVERDNARGVWPRWAVVQADEGQTPTAGDTLFVDSLDTLLDSLSKTFTMKDAGTSDGAVRHITGQRLSDGPRGPMPDGVDIWIDRTTRQLDRIELRWEERSPRDGRRPGPPSDAERGGGGAGGGGGGGGGAGPNGDRGGPDRPGLRGPRPEERGPRSGPPRDGPPREGDGPRGDDGDMSRPPPGPDGFGPRILRPPPPRRLIIQRVDAPPTGFADNWFSPEGH